MLKIRVLLLIFSIVSLSSCGPRPINKRNQKNACFSSGAAIIYGENNISPIKEIKPTDIQHSVAAVVESKRLIENQFNEEDDKVLFKGLRLAHNYRMCDESVNMNRAGALCSAFLISPNLVVTAGHCFSKNIKDACKERSFVFDFTEDVFPMDRFESGFINKKNIYRCKKIVSLNEDGERGDYAVIELDRSVEQREPLKLLDPKELVFGDWVTTIGFPQGQTMHISEEGKFYKMSEDRRWLYGQIDTFFGNSGGPIIDQISNHVVGLHTHGVKDSLILNKEKGCYTYSSRCEDPKKCGVTKAFNINKIPGIQNLITESHTTQRTSLGCE